MTRVRGAALLSVGAVFALAAVAPLFFSASGDVLDNMVLATAYVVMALGLNIIVGFAGLGSSCCVTIGGCRQPAGV